MTFEVTVESVKEAVLAQKHGAKRVELCSALDLGGITPSLGLIQNVIDNLDQTEVHVLIRPRPGHFEYSKKEVLTILTDIDTCAQLGVDGVVFGVLRSDATLDLEITKLLTKHSKSHGLEVTFHRAIDFCQDLESAIHSLIEMGVDRILTSGQKPTAFEGIKTIQQMVNWSNNKIQIMAGSGVNVQNVIQLSESGIDALHFSIRQPVGTDNLQMGTTFVPDEEKLKLVTQLF